MEVAILAALASGATMVAYLVVRAWRSDARRTRRVLRRARVVPIAELVDGQLACIVGIVEVDDELIEAMASGRSCVAYDTTVQYFQGSDFTIPVRAEIVRRIVPFFVVDETGRVRIDAPHAALCNKPVARSERYEERIIEPGATVRIVGSVVLEPARSATGEHGFREGAWSATLTGSLNYPLLVDCE
jgi:hypothetical protein